MIISKKPFQPKRPFSSGILSFFLFISIGFFFHSCEQEAVSSIDSLVEESTEQTVSNRTDPTCDCMYRILDIDVDYEIFKYNLGNFGVMSNNLCPSCPITGAFQSIYGGGPYPPSNCYYVHNDPVPNGWFSFNCEVPWNSVIDGFFTLDCEWDDPDCPSSNGSLNGEITIQVACTNKVSKTDPPAGDCQYVSYFTQPMVIEHDTSDPFSGLFQIELQDCGCKPVRIF